ncbi:ROK family protein [Pseudonocardia nigra]|uniref:ROK family protein n=1 Tax=Pseudonocardia nigra TaxID=1921578 RepID=UPI001C5CEA3B|nr:ROK family protein [Pseudonocardia nigra]
MTVVPVLEVGGTHVTAARVDTARWAVPRGSTIRSNLDSGGEIQDIVAALAGAGRRAHPRPVRRWGVAVPAPFDYEAGVAWFSDVGKFDSLHGLDLRVALRHVLSSAEVHFVNDAEAITTGQWLSGAARGARRALGVTRGTGVGSAWLVNGVAVQEGPGVAPGGRLDLLEVDGSPLEHLVSRRAMLAPYAQLAGDDAPVADAVDLAEWARGGNSAVAARALHEAMRALGAVLAPRGAAFEADVIVVGGSVALSSDLVVPPLAAAVDDVAALTGCTVRLVPAQTGVDGALIGAAREAVSH